jgi:hypothetical protein
MRKLAVVLILCGVGLLVYGLLSFHAGGGPIGSPENIIGWDITYYVAARLEAAIGAVLLTAGCLLWKWR